MTPRERARLAVLKSEIRRLEKQFGKAKARRDTLALEVGDLRLILQALLEEKDTLEQGQLMLRNVG
jgi:hypothetical protein